MDRKQEKSKIVKKAKNDSKNLVDLSTFHITDGRSLVKFLKENVVKQSFPQTLFEDFCIERQSLGIHIEKNKILDDCAEESVPSKDSSSENEKRSTKDDFDAENLICGKHNAVAQNCTFNPTTCSTPMPKSHRKGLHTSRPCVQKEILAETNDVLSGQLSNKLKSRAHNYKNVDNSGQNDSKIDDRHENNKTFHTKKSKDTKKSSKLPVKMQKYSDRNQENIANKVFIDKTVTHSYDINSNIRPLDLKRCENKKISKHKECLRSGAESQNGMEEIIEYPLLSPLESFKDRHETIATKDNQTNNNLLNSNSSSIMDLRSSSSSATNLTRKAQSGKKSKRCQFKAKLKSDSILQSPKHLEPLLSENKSAQKQTKGTSKAVPAISIPKKSKGKELKKLTSKKKLNNDDVSTCKRSTSTSKKVDATQSENSQKTSTTLRRSTRKRRRPIAFWQNTRMTAYYYPYDEQYNKKTYDILQNVKSNKEKNFDVLKSKVEKSRKGTKNIENETENLTEIEQNDIIKVENIPRRILKHLNRIEDSPLLDPIVPTQASTPDNLNNKGTQKQKNKRPNRKQMKI